MAGVVAESVARQVKAKRSGPVADYVRAQALFPAGAQESLIDSGAIGRPRTLPWDVSNTEETAATRANYAKMFRSPAVKAALMQKVLNVASLTFNIIPASKSERDVDIARFIKYQYETALGGPDFDGTYDVLPSCSGLIKLGFEILLPALVHKYSVCSKAWFCQLWERGEWRGKRFLRDLKARDDVDLQIDDYGNVVGIRSTVAPGEVLSIRDYVVFRNMPIYGMAGESDLRAAESYWRRLEILLVTWMTHLDSFVTPAIVIRYPSTWTGSEIDDLIAKVKAIRSRRFIGHQDDAVVQALDLAKRGENEMLAAVQHLEERIVLSIMGAYLQMMTSGQTGTGDIRGNANTQKSTSELFVWYLVESLRTVIDTQITPAVLDVNFAGKPDVPRIAFGGVNYAETKTAIETIRLAQEAGFTASSKSIQDLGLQASQSPEDALHPVTTGLGGLAPSGFGTMPQAAGGPPGASTPATPTNSAPATPNASNAVILPEDPASGVTIVPDTPVANTALNGAQIDSLLSIIERVSLKQLPPDGGVELILLAFPTMARDAVNSLVYKSAGVPRPAVSFAQSPALRPHSQHGTEVSLPGAEGKRAAELLDQAVQQGVQTTYELCKRAVGRLLDRGRQAVVLAQSLFDADELQQFQQQITNTLAAGHLLGQASVRLRYNRAVQLQGAIQLSQEPVVFFEFAEPIRPLPPLEAIDYFAGLVPGIAADPLALTSGLAGRALFLAGTSDRVILDRVKSAILTSLNTGVPMREVANQIEEILDSAGVTPRNPQYAEAVYRTQTMEAQRVGAQREFNEPDVADVFPAWQYTNAKLKTSRPEHAARDGNIYDRSLVFAEVRGLEAKDVINCTCGFIAMDKWEVEAFLANGGQVIGRVA